MNVSLAGFALFLHITVAIAAFMIAGVLHVAFNVLPRVRTVAEMRPWTAVIHRLEPLLPILALVLLGLGAWLVHLGEHTDDAFRFTDGWVLTAIISLIVVEAAAGVLLAPRTKALIAKVEAAPDGAVPADIRRATVNPLMWHVGHIATFAFVGVVFLMAAKPDGAYAPLFPIVGALIGVALSQAQLRACPPIAAAAASVPAPRAAGDTASAAHSS